MANANITDENIITIKCGSCRKGKFILNIFKSGNVFMTCAECGSTMDSKQSNIICNIFDENKVNVVRGLK